MKHTLLIIGIMVSSLCFSQNTSEVVDVINNGKVENNEDRDTQNYIAEYLTSFFDKTYEKPDGFYLVIEQKTPNNKNTLEIESISFLNSTDIKNIILNKNGNKYPTVLFELNETGSRKLKKITSENFGNGIAIIVDKKIITMPMIVAEISDGKLEYNSILPYNETELIVNKLK
ncbi:hypothetical protein U9K52_03685 [Chryseobacterium sp. MHB01]|uniref:SecDF P1 head subdomain-containing protein n=1 Tax=Chryseobacterium sp. MHB01 TaxID=3109433 RepID=UPI002B003ABF|nr:hypothetical protein [Chryseobacterium sp. MHB01]MEA1848007.1 hypothetical protein [Chryseobacterium sp. MHB01]